MSPTHGPRGEIAGPWDTHASAYSPSHGLHAWDSLNNTDIDRATEGERPFEYARPISK